MASILQSIVEMRIRKLTEKRNEALKNKDYDRVWILNMKIDNAINRLITYDY